jgi:putative peptidoglycan lipid II flippase
MTRDFFRSTGVVGSLTLVSRISGLLRDMVFSRAFGAGVLMDAFLVAFKIPNFLRRLFAEGAFSQAFVPVVSEYKVRRSHDEVRELVDGVAGTLGVALFVLTAIGVMAAPLLILLFAPGFSGEPDKFGLTVDMLRWTFPYLLFISLTALAAGVLNSYGRFAVPAFTPVLLNLTLIVFALWVAPRSSSPGIALAAGVFVAGLVQLLLQIPFLLRLRLLGRPRWRRSHEGVRRVGRLMLPAIFGSSVQQVGLLLDTLVASFLATGSIAWLYYADRLMEFPLGVFSIALATVILPGLARHHAAAESKAFSATIDWALKLVFLIVLPASVAMFVLAGPLIVTIFHYGEFSDHDARMSMIALMAYSFGLLGYSLVKVLAPGFFARQDTRTPVRIGIRALSLNVGLNLLVVLPLGIYADISGIHAGLALSSGISAFLNAVLLYRGLRRDGVLQHGPGWRTLLPRLTAAVAVMAGLLLWLAGDLALWLGLPAVERAGRLTVCVLAGAGAYFAVLFLTGVRPRDFAGTERTP